MKSLGYEKAVRMSLIGFVVLSLIVLIIINVYFNKEQEFLLKDNDIKLTESILTNNSNITMNINDVYNQTYLKADWLERVFNDQLDISGEVLDYIKYSSYNDISYIDLDDISPDKSYGNIIIDGKIDNQDNNVINQINNFNNFFVMENALEEIDHLNVSSIYYSKNNYVAYYPYEEGDVSADNYEPLFNNVDNMITQLELLQEEDLISAINNGWQRTTLIDSGESRLTYSVAMPVIVDGKVDGILVCSIGQKDIDMLILDKLEGVDMYLVNQNEEVIYSSVNDIELQSNVYDVLSNQYNDEITYYKNKFPQALEKRVIGDYSMYISLFEKNDWYLVYVYNNKQLVNKWGIIIINILIVAFAAIVVFYGINYSNKKRNELELNARNAKYDSMTNMLNHKNIIEVLDGYYKNKRVKQLAVFMIDIDDFKKVNDTYGHWVGDEVIYLCSSVIKKILEKRTGIAGRYGGEEFLVIVPRIEKEIVYDIAEEIRVVVSESILSELNLNITVSIGLHHVVKPIEVSLADLINTADANLYTAKRTGKNKVVKTSRGHEEENEEEDE